MQLLLIGASSFIGKEIFNQASQLGISVLGTATNPQNSTLHKFDLKTDSIGDLLGNTSINGMCAVVTAFYCGHERMVTNLKEAELVNLTGTQRLLDELEKRSIKTLWFSTEQVFCGYNRMAPYTEDDATTPVNAYGRHKAEIECYVSEHLQNVVIYRLSQNVAPYIGGIHIFNDIYCRYQKGERQFETIKGQILSPTDVRDTAKWAIEGVLRNIPGGIYNFANPESMTRKELVDRFLRVVGSDATVKEVQLEKFGFKESRPMDTRMCIDKIMKVMPDIKFTPISKVIEDFNENLRCTQKNHSVLQRRLP